MKLETNDRGFMRGVFVDENHIECSIQESSATDPPLLWIGCNEPNAMCFSDDLSDWQPFALPANVECTTRMHISQKTAEQLIPLLQEFVRSGYLQMREDVE
jgi:hypothetical protein